jgi:Fe-S cluster biosynthesis and repair protein YggX
MNALTSVHLVYLVFHQQIAMSVTKNVWFVWIVKNKFLINQKNYFKINLFFYIYKKVLAAQYVDLIISETVQIFVIAI